MQIKRGNTIPTDGILLDGQLGYYRPDNSLYIGCKTIIDPNGNTSDPANYTLKTKCLIPKFDDFVTNLISHSTFITDIVNNIVNESLTKDEVIAILNTALEDVGPDIITNIVENLTEETILELFESLFQNNTFVENIVNNLVTHQLTEEQIENILNQVFEDNSTIVGDVIHQYLSDNSLSYVKTINGNAPDTEGNIDITEGSSLTYTTPKPIEIAVGKIPEGYEFTNASILDVFNKMFFGIEPPPPIDPHFIPVLFYGVVGNYTDYSDDGTNYDEEGNILYPVINWYQEIGKGTIIKTKEECNDIDLEINAWDYLFIAYPKEWGDIIWEEPNIKSNHLASDIIKKEEILYNGISYKLYLYLGDTGFEGKLKF